MPNYCVNQLRIDGNAKDIKALLELVKGKDEDGEDLVFDFEKILPTPLQLLQHSAPQDNKRLAKKFSKLYGAPDWYEWRIKNWSTKWNLTDEAQFDWGKKWISGCFDTAWSPPRKIIKALAHKFPRLSFLLSYCEPGEGFAGELEIKGKKVRDECYEASKEEQLEKYNEIAEHHGMLFEKEVV